MKNTTFSMLAQHINVKRMMYLFEEEEVCNFGAFFALNSEREKEVSSQMLSLIPAVHAGLRLSMTGESNQFKLLEDNLWEIPVIECEEPAGEEHSFSKIYQYISNWVMKPFEKGGALCGFALFHFGKNNWYAGEKFHHILIDQNSFSYLTEWQNYIAQEILKNGFEKTRAAVREDERFLQKLQSWEAPRYASREQLKAWLERDYSDNSDAWMDWMRAVSAKAGCRKKRIGGELHRKINEFAEHNQVSVESIWYAAFFAERCIRKGIFHAVFGRMSEYRSRNEHSVAGLFSRALPVALDMNKLEGKNLVSICRYIDRQFQISLRYGEYDLGQMCEIGKGSSIAFDTLLSFHPKRYEMKSEKKFWVVNNNGIDTPLRIWINHEDSRTSLQIFYQLECCSGEEAESLVRRCEGLLAQLLAHVPWEQLSLLGKGDREAYERLNSCREVRPERTVPQLFLKRLLAQADYDVIFMDAGQEWTKKEILTFFFQTINYLKSCHVGTGDIVGVCLERSVQLPVILYAVMECGAAFLPIGTEETEERKKLLSRECKVVICEDSFREIQSNPIMERVETAAAAILNQKIVVEKWKRRRAYVLHTSGSTGKPKLVQISQYSLMCRLQWMYETMGAGEITLQKTVQTFDVSVWELLLSPAYGGTLYMLPQGEEKYPDRLMETIEQRHITRVHFVPGMLEVFFRYVRRRLQKAGRKVWECALREIIVSGEELRKEQTETVYRVLPHVKLYNLYGPAECTIDVSCHLCVPGERRIPIGRAVSNTELLVMSPDGERVMPCGMEGELCVTGDLVGMGYLGEYQNSGYRMIQGKYAYMTGDRVYLDEQGELIYCGRKDSQYKLRGMRVDTGAIETLLLERNHSLRHVHVSVKQNRLIGFYEAEHPIHKLESCLEGMLPGYSIPRIWLWYSEFPKSLNGKTDYKKLEQAYEGQTAHHGDAKVLDKEDSREIQILSRLLSEILPSYDGSEDFFESGLDSFGAIQLVENLSHQGYDCSFADVYRYPTMASLAEKLEEQSRMPDACRAEAGATGAKLEYFKAAGSERLILFIPYGGGGSESYGSTIREIENLAWDIGVVNLDDVPPGKEGREILPAIADELWREMQGYKTITLFGTCVGSALAIAVARKIQREKGTLKHVYLAGTLPGSYTKIAGRKCCLWDVMTDGMICRVLGFANRNSRGQGDSERGEPIMKSRIPKFRRDVKCFFDYMEGREEDREKIQAPLTLFFGENDWFTKGWKRKQRDWRVFFDSEIQVVCVEKAGHYFLGKRIGTFLGANFCGCQYDILTKKQGMRKNVEI